MKNKILYLITGICLSSNITGQVLISDADFDAASPIDCSGAFSPSTTAANFFDTGGNGLNYSDSEDETIVFCPGAGASKVAFLNDAGAGYTWDIDASDTLYIFDGPSTASPLLRATNSIVDPVGVSYVSSTFSNTSGCLTLQFVSDATTNGAGWGGIVICQTPNQPIEVHMSTFIVGEANGANDNTGDLLDADMLMPLADSGYTNICLGDSILFVNTSEYPYEPGASLGADNGGGYNQSNPSNHITKWTFSSGDVFFGDSIWFKPNSSIGYFAHMEVTDNQGESAELASKVRVSTTPSFASCFAVDPDICLGQATTLIGGITPSDTAGVNATGSSFQIEGSFGSSLFVPDNQTQVYSTDINISGFPTNTVLQNINDLESVCISMEHSYLGDLEMMLTCPNGSSVILFNSFSGAGELFTGGFGGGSTFLGGANDQPGAAGLAQGVCEEYCFSEMASAMPDWASGYNTVAASGVSAGSMIVPGMYEPEGSFATDLAGCPLNGTWTLTTKDNIGSDDGWICEWGILFNGSLNPDNETYTPIIIDENWLSDPTILIGTSDTAVIVAPNVVGNYGYTFEVKDNFGCSNDTTIYVNVIAGPSILGNDSTCEDYFQFSNTFAPSSGSISGGNWFYEGPGNLSITTSPTGPPTTTFLNPTITPDVNGTYTVYFNDNVCNDTVQTEISFLDYPVALIFGEDTICQNDTAKLFTILNYGESATWTDNSGNWISSDTTALGASTGTYTVTVSNFCGTSSASMDVLVQPCSVPNVITPNGSSGQNDKFYTRYAEVYPDVNLTIFNRWGKVVYKTDSYDNTWGGEKNNGKDLHGGVYYYVMTWDGNTKDEAGTITVFMD
jgi:gliding motility-associated-like protein